MSAVDGYRLWSAHFDRELEDVFKLQDELARTMVDAMLLELRGARQTLSPAKIWHPQGKSGKLPDFLPVRWSACFVSACLLR